MKHIAPAYLFLGSPEALYNHTLKFIKSVLCAKSGCDINNKRDMCISCKQIEQKQHHLLCWLTPENQYTVAQLDIIFKTIIFALDKNQHFFFVIDRADLLGHACANSLLKSLEEPPAGYHFLLLSSYKEGILPTVSSRCVIETIDSTSQVSLKPLFEFFTKNNRSLNDFNKELEQNKVLERDILAFLDQIYNYWVSNLKNQIINNNLTSLNKIERIIRTIDQSRNYLPMPGSSKLFLRDLFLKISAFINN